MVTQAMSEEKKPIKGVSGTSSSDTLDAFLRNLLEASEITWGGATTAGEILKRHLAVVDALSKLSDLGWERSSGGYQVPEGMSR